MYVVYMYVIQVANRNCGKYTNLVTNSYGRNKGWSQVTVMALNISIDSDATIINNTERAVMSNAP